MRGYIPRRQSKRRLDGDCPDGVLAIYDSGDCGERFTVFYREAVAGTTFANTWLGYRGMSEAPFHPVGVGIYGEMEAYQVAAYRYRVRHQAAKWSTLPEDVKRCVRQDLAA